MATVEAVRVEAMGAVATEAGRVVAAMEAGRVVAAMEVATEVEA